MTINTKNLRVLSEAAKGWGNCNQAWLDSSEDEPAAVVGHISEDGEKYPVVVVDCDQYDAAQDSIKLARFYAAANATAMLALLDALERKDRLLNAACNALQLQPRQTREVWKDGIDIDVAVAHTKARDAAIEAITKELT